MKILKTILLGAFISFISSQSLLAGKWISRNDLVADEEADLLPESVPVSKFAQKARSLSQEERNEVEGLNFHNSLLRASGVKFLADEVIGLFPNLRTLVLSYCGLDDPTDSQVITSLLERFPTLEFIMIDGNGVALAPQSLLSQASTNTSLLQSLRSKVVISMESTIRRDFSSLDPLQYADWQDTQARFHKRWASEEPNMLLIH